MLRQLQRSDSSAAAAGLTAGDDSVPIMRMEHRVTNACDECGSSYFITASRMAALCPECAHYLYGYPACAHVMVAGRCESCGWDGSHSAYVAAIRDERLSRR